MSAIRFFLTPLLVFCISSATTAATLNVNTWSDAPTASQCSLRDAITAANTNAAVRGCVAGSVSGTDTILVPAGVYRLSAGTGGTYWNEDNNQAGDLDIRSGGLAIRGASARDTVIIAMPRDRVFEFGYGGTQNTQPIFLEHFTLVGGDVRANGGAGNTTSGGTVAVSSLMNSAVTVRNVVLRDGVAEYGGNLFAYVNDQVPNSKFRLESASVLDGRAQQGGGMQLYVVAPDYRIEVLNSTVSGNQLLADNTFYGGGIAVSGRVRMNHVTVTSNRPDGVLLGGNSSSDPYLMDVSNSILWGNGDGVAQNDLTCTYGAAANWGFLHHSVFGFARCQYWNNGNASLGSNDLKITPRFDFGAGLPTHAVLPGSAARQKGKPNTTSAGENCLNLDARGVFRPGTLCDAGAYQHRADVTVNSTADLPDNNPGNGACEAVNGQCTLRAAVMEASASGGRWMVDLPIGTYTLTRPIVTPDEAGGDLDVKPVAGTPPLNLALFGQGDPGQTHIVGGSDRVFQLTGIVGTEPEGPSRYRPLAFALANATVRDGSLTVDASEPSGYLAGGGIRQLGGHTLLYNLVLRDNQIASGSAAAIYAQLSPVRVYLGGSASELPFSTSLAMERFAVIDNGSLLEGTYGSVEITEFTLNNYLPERSSMRNGTMAGNLFGKGMALQVVPKDFGLSFVTIADNHALAPYTLPLPAGVYLHDGAALVSHSVFAGNTVAGEPWDCSFDGNVLGLGYVAIGNDRQCVLSGDATGNQINVDPLLGELETVDGMAVMPLSFSSPLRNAVPLADCVDVRGSRNGFDASGAQRPASGGCNIGASEDRLPTAALAPGIFADGFETPP